MSIVYGLGSEPSRKTYGHKLLQTAKAGNILFCRHHVFGVLFLYADYQGRVGIRVVLEMTQFPFGHNGHCWVDLAVSCIGSEDIVN